MEYLRSESRTPRTFARRQSLDPPRASTTPQRIKTREKNLSRRTPHESFVCLIGCAAPESREIRRGALIRKITQYVTSSAFAVERDTTRPDPRARRRPDRRALARASPRAHLIIRAHHPRARSRARARAHPTRRRSRVTARARPRRSLEIRDERAHPRARRRDASTVPRARTTRRRAHGDARATRDHLHVARARARRDRRPRGDGGRAHDSHADARALFGPRVTCGRHVGDVWTSRRRVCAPRGAVRRAESSVGRRRIG